MTIAVVIFSVLLVALGGYLMVVIGQVRSITRQLEQRSTATGARSAVTLELVGRDLEQLVAQVNATVRTAEAASARTRIEERRFRSFIADISHDVRTPLTTVRGYLQLMARSELEQTQRTRLEVARRHTEELSILVDRLYEYTYLLEVEPVLEAETLDAGVLLGECLLAMTTELEDAGLDVCFEPPAACVLVTDRQMLTRIVQNLARNAAHHGDQALQVAVSRHPLPGTASDTGTGVTISFTNALPPDAEIDAGRLFDRFYTADRSRSGRTSGLGLSIVQVLTEQLGGTADASVDEGRLSIRVTLPDLGQE